MARRSILAATLVALCIHATEAGAVWLPPPAAAHLSVADATLGTIIGKSSFKPRVAGNTKGAFKFKAKNSTCPLTDQVPFSGDELICVLHLTPAIGTGFSTANVIAFTDVKPNGVIAFAHQDPIYAVPAGIMNAVSGECYPYDPAFLANLGIDTNVLAAISSYDGQLVAFDKAPLTPMPGTLPCALF